MKHTVDLSKYQIRTDLAIDLVDSNKIESEIITDNKIKTTRTIINKHIAKKKLIKKKDIM